MKKIIIAILIVLLLTLSVACSRDIEGVIPTPTMQATPMPTPKPAPTPALSILEAEERVRSNFGEHSIITHLPDMDRWVDEVFFYAFSVDYSAIGGAEYPLPDGIYLYAWVDASATVGWVWFEEPSAYANIPDSMIPIPMRDGEILPYVAFSPPSRLSMSTHYAFDDWRDMALYQEQLREAGFTDHGYATDESTGARFGSLWTYERSDVGARLIVGLSGGEGFSITMRVERMG